MPAALERCAQEDAQEIGRDWPGDDVRAETQDVGCVVCAAHPGCADVVDQGRADERMRP